MDRSSTGRPVPDQPALILAKVSHWCEAADLALRDALDSDRDSICAQVNAGELELWCVDGGSLWLVTRAEPASGELIVCCAQGRGLLRAGEAFYKIAQANGLRWIRFFSARRGMQRLLKQWRFAELGRVYRCEVSSVG